MKATTKQLLKQEVMTIIFLHHLEQTIVEGPKYTMWGLWKTHRWTYRSDSHSPTRGGERLHSYKLVSHSNGSLIQWLWRAMDPAAMKKITQFKKMKQNI